ncbi:MAG: hypothetical protein ACLUFN_02620 [Eubacterium sp.]
MTELIENGDYVKCEDKTHLKKTDYIDELLQNIRLILTAKRGKFYPNKDFGSYIRDNAEEPKADYALNYARQAVSSIDGVYIKSSAMKENEIIFRLTVNGEEREVSVNIENNI